MADFYSSGAGFTITTTSGAGTWGGYSPATTAPVISAGTVNVYPTSSPRKRTPLEWLEDEVERVCAKTRPGLALS